MMGVIASISLSLLLFLPALVELKKPKDAGPRFISDSDSITPLKRLNDSSFNLENQPISLQKNQTGLADLSDIDDHEFT
jgi:hypothetical protein